MLKIKISKIISEALTEDLDQLGDITSNAIFSKSWRGKAQIVAKQNGILAGGVLAKAVFKKLDPRLKVFIKVRDANPIKRHQVILEIFGSFRSILAAERVALNFIQRLSGIATLTYQFVSNSKRRQGVVDIFDTRKTTPLLRSLEKYAVQCGGGRNHRFGLYDKILIKDNHLAVLRKQFKRPIIEAVRRCRMYWPKHKIEIECENLSQVKDAIRSKASIILLDNMSPRLLSKAVRLVDGKAQTEASGGICLATVAKVASTGVDRISIGALTHSAQALDFSLEIIGDS